MTQPNIDYVAGATASPEKITWMERLIPEPSGGALDLGCGAGLYSSWLAKNNWQVQAVPGVKLRFVSGSGGVAHLARHPQVKLVKDNGDGTALFELRP